MNSSGVIHAKNGRERRLRRFIYYPLAFFVGLLASFDPLIAQQPAGQALDTLRLSLDSSVILAMEGNKELQAVEAGVRSARYKELEQWSAVMPTLDGAADYSRYVKKPVIFLPEDSPMAAMGMKVMEIGSSNSYTASLTAALPLFAMPIYRNIQAAKVDRKIADEQVRNTKVTLAGDVKLAFIGVLLAEESLRVMDSSIRTAERTLRNVENLAAQGMMPEYDLIRARVQVSNLKPMYVQAKQGVDAALLNFRTLLALPTDQPLALEGTLDELVELYAVDSIAGGDPLATNSDLRMLELQGERLDRQYQLVRETLWPTLAAFGSYQWSTQSNTFDFANYQWVNTAVVGLKLSVPLFAGLKKHWQIQQVKIGRDQLAKQTDYARERMSTLVLVTRQQMIAAMESMEASRQGQELAERGVAIARVRYDSGAGTLLELNDAEMALTQSSLNFNRARYNYVKAYMEYLRICGQTE